MDRDDMFHLSARGTHSLTDKRDVILPDEMKDLMNNVTEAKKIAEANAISRREKTAVIRSQANTAKLLVENPALMRMR
jgi:hypothetical protein